jgi:hypothetical protein
MHIGSLTVHHLKDPSEDILPKTFIMLKILFIKMRGNHELISNKINVLQQNKVTVFAKQDYPVNVRLDFAFIARPLPANKLVKFQLATRDRQITRVK